MRLTIKGGLQSSKYGTQEEPDMLLWHCSRDATADKLSGL